EELLVRSKDFYDNATPSGNSAAVDVILKLAKLTSDEKYERFAVTVLRMVAPQIKHHPQAFGRVLSALEFYLNPTKEIVILGEKNNELEREIWSEYLPNKVLVLAKNSQENIELIPLLRERNKIDGKTTVYVCENFTCQRPVMTTVELREQLSL
ncbi:MAG TPA: hypothetical protein VNI60_12235, partial [Pyrinomonadaceae bacterium]|nr:hypothetical protein [Pyrinomonadaceae bacterium]